MGVRVLERGLPGGENPEPRRQADEWLAKGDPSDLLFKIGFTTSDLSHSRRELEYLHHFFLLYLFVSCVGKKK